MAIFTYLFQPFHAAVKTLVGLSGCIDPSLLEVNAYTGKVTSQHMLVGFKADFFSAYRVLYRYFMEVFPPVAIRGTGHVILVTASTCASHFPHCLLNLLGIAAFERFS